VTCSTNGSRGTHIGNWWESQRPRPRCRWVDKIRMDLGEIRWSAVDWIGLAKDRNRWRALVNVVINFRVP
jgi:hypothetical protein